MESRSSKRSVVAHAPCVRYSGGAFAPATGTYRGVDTPAMNFSTTEDSGCAQRAVDRISALGAAAPLALAAMWEAGFALEAGPLSTWRN